MGRLSEVIATNDTCATSADAKKSAFTKMSLLIAHKLESYGFTFVDSYESTAGTLYYSVVQNDENHEYLRVVGYIGNTSGTYVRIEQVSDATESATIYQKTSDRSLTTTSASNSDGSKTYNVSAYLDIISNGNDFILFFAAASYNASSFSALLGYVHVGDSLKFIIIGSNAYGCLYTNGVGAGYIVKSSSYLKVIDSNKVVIMPCYYSASSYEPTNGVDDTIQIMTMFNFSSAALTNGTDYQIGDDIYTCIGGTTTYMLFKWGE